MISQNEPAATYDINQKKPSDSLASSSEKQIKVTESFKRGRRQIQADPASGSGKSNVIKVKIPSKVVSGIHSKNKKIRENQNDDNQASKKSTKSKVIKKPEKMSKAKASRKKQTALNCDKQAENIS